MSDFMPETREFFGNAMKQMKDIPEGHLMGIDLQGNIVDRGPMPEGADETWGSPCLVGFHDDCCKDGCGCCLSGHGKDQQ